MRQSFIHMQDRDDVSEYLAIIRQWAVQLVTYKKNGSICFLMSNSTGKIKNIVKSKSKEFENFGKSRKKNTGSLKI